MKKKERIKTFKGHTDAVSCLSFSSNDTHVASGSLSGQVLLHSIITGQAVATMDAPAGVQAITSLEYSPFRKSLLGTASEDGAVVLWDTNARAVSHKFAAQHRAPIGGLSFSPINHLLLATVGLDKKVVFYDLTEKRAVKSINTEQPMTSCSFLDDGVTIAAGTTQGSVLLFDLRGGDAPYRTLNVFGQHTPIASVQFQRTTTGAKASSSAGASTPGVKAAAEKIAAVASPRRRKAPADSGAATPGAREAAAPAAHAATPPASERSVTDGIFSPLVGTPAASGTSSLDAAKATLQDEASRIVRERQDRLSLTRRTPAAAVPAAASASVTPPAASSADISGSYPSIFSPIGASDAPSASASSFAKTPAERPAVGIAALQAKREAERASARDAHESPTSNLMSRFSSSPDVPAAAPSPARPTTPPAVRAAAEAPKAATPVAQAEPVVAKAATPVAQAEPEVPKAATPVAQAQPEVPKAATPSPAAAVVPSPAHAAAPSPATTAAAASPAFDPTIARFEADFVRSTLEETLAVFRADLHAEMQNMHLDMLRQFELQKAELRGIVQEAMDSFAPLLALQDDEMSLDDDGRPHFFR